MSYRFFFLTSKVFFNKGCNFFYSGRRGGGLQNQLQLAIDLSHTCPNLFLNNLVHTSRIHIIPLTRCVLNYRVRARADRQTDRFPVDWFHLKIDRNRQFWCRNFPYNVSFWSNCSQIHTQADVRRHTSRWRICSKIW